MVARKPGAEWRLGDVLSGAFMWWRRVLSRGTSAAGRAVTTISRAIAASPAATGQAGWIAAGLGALVAGAIAGIVLAPAGQPSLAALAARSASVFWAGMRLLVMRLAAPSLATDRGRLTHAWALGLLPWIAGVTPELRLAAWAASGVVTYLALQRASDGAAGARIAVAWAWGAQALIFIIVALLRNLLVALTIAGS